MNHHTREMKLPCLALYFKFSLRQTVHRLNSYLCDLIRKRWKQHEV